MRCQLNRSPRPRPLALCIFLLSATAVYGQTMAGTVSVPVGPRSSALNPQTNKVYVVGYGNGVAVIDGATDTATSVNDPNAVDTLDVAVNPVTNKIYVGNTDSCGPLASITVIDGATNQFVNVASDGLLALAVNPVTNKIYGADCTGAIAVIDGSTNVITYISDPNANNPIAVAVNPLTNRIYVVNEGFSNEAAAFRWWMARPTPSLTWLTPTPSSPTRSP